VAHAEASAKSVEAAVTAAAAKLGLQADQVEIEILEDPVPSTFGFIGSPARVRVTSRDPANSPGSAGGTGAAGAAEPGDEVVAGVSRSPVDPGQRGVPLHTAEPGEPLGPPTGVIEAPASSSPAEVFGTPAPSAPAEATGERNPTAVADAEQRSGPPATPTVTEGTLSSEPPSAMAGERSAGSAGSLPGAAEERLPESRPDATDSLPSPDTPEGAAASSSTGAVSSAGAMAFVGSVVGTGTTPESPPSAVPSAVAPTPDTSPTTSVAQSATGTRPPRRDNSVDAIDPKMVEADTERAGDFLEGLLDALDFDGDITTWVDEVGGHIDLEGEDLDVLVGPNGETLDALQELTRLAVLRQSKRRARLLLDINGFRARQREQLVSVVRATVEQVIRTREDYELRPMTPAERKIVHDAVAALEGAVTESLGEDPNRRVIIRPT
jgi:spoIIIJ-associated protein